jgi:hypothetical protein
MDQLAELVAVPRPRVGNERISSSAEPLFNSRSRARALIADMDRYYVDRYFVSTCTRVWSCYSSAMARDFPLLSGVCGWRHAVGCKASILLSSRPMRFQLAKDRVTTRRRGCLS